MILCLRGARALRAGVRPALQRAPRRRVALTATQDWEKLGIGDKLVAAVDAMGLDAPTDAQRDAIPGVLNGEDLLFAAETGSGKTLAYLLPTIARLKAEEFNVDKLDELRRPKQPRAFVLVLAFARRASSFPSAISRAHVLRRFCRRTALQESIPVNEGWCHRICLC